MVKSINQFECELCATTYSSFAIAQKCEKSGKPVIPIWVKVGDIVRLKNWDDTTYTQVKLKKWCLTLAKEVSVLDDQQLLALPGDREFHQWMLGLDAPVKLSPHWEHPRWVVGLEYLLTPKYFERMRRCDLIKLDFKEVAKEVLLESIYTS